MFDLFGAFLTMKSHLSQSHVFQEKLTKETFSVLLMIRPPLWIVNTDTNTFDTDDWFTSILAAPTNQTQI